MKIYLELPVQSRGLQRVYDALVRYKPDTVEIVKDKRQAELIVHHVIGRYDHVAREIEVAKKRKQKYAMIQYCLRSTMEPMATDWVDLWKNAKTVWSYYHLPSILLSEYCPFFNFSHFYHAPLGVDSSVFQDRKMNERDFIITCSGQHALSESVKECVMAAKNVGRKVFHLGHELRRGSDITCLKDISDYTLSHFYSRSEFVSGLRRVEGFEQGVIEGALCGARPIVFDRPEMRTWFNEFAIFIPEGERDDVTFHLTNLFKKGTRTVSEEEKELIKERFDWKTIISGFYERVLI